MAKTRIRSTSVSSGSPKKPVPSPVDEPKLEEVFQIIRLMSSTDLAELELETPDLKISLKRGSPDPVVQMIPAPHPAFVPPPVPHPLAAQPHPVPGHPGKSHPAQIPTVPEPPKVDYHKVASPMAGTFYRSPSPSAPPYIKEGDTVKAGQPVCIIEAMKLMNEIKADKAGKIVKIPFENAQPVEKGAALFLIDPNG